MKRFPSPGFIFCPVFMIFVQLPFFSEDLLSHHREWLENVSPIITKAESEVFSGLRTNEEREKFIRFFWRQRDPYPDTEKNEFAQEYMDRIRFADQNFGHGTSKRGSQTERGYHYLLLGPPLERHFFTTHSQIWPLELWFYKGEIEYGLPPYFYLIFYQPEGLGEYRLYSPEVEGPEKLVIPVTAPRALSRSSAFQLIKKISAELANASLSYLPGDESLRTPGFSSASLLASIRSVPEKKFSDAYARSFLDYKDYVETEYSHAYVESGFAASVFRHEGGFFLHWTVEPRKMNLVARGDRYQAVYSLILRLEDGQGNLVLEKEEEIPLALTPEQAKQHERRTFAFQDILPVIRGRYRLFGLLKNKTAQEFASFSCEVVVPEENAGFGPLLLYHSREKIGAAESRSLRAFTFSGNHYLVDAANEFPAGGEMGAYIQVYGLKDKDLAVDDEAFLLLEIRPADLEEAVLSLKTTLSEALTEDGTGLDIRPFSLASLKPGYYSAELSLADGDGGKLLTTREDFVLLAQASPVLPWVYAKTHRPTSHPEHLFLLAFEYFQTRQYDQALRAAEEAVKLKEEPRTRLLMARILYALGRFQDSVAAARPLYEESKSREAAKILAASHAALKDSTSALIYLEELLAGATETGVLNLAAECYLNLNQPERALLLLRRSLEIDPDQPAIKTLEERAKKQLQKQR